MSLRYPHGDPVGCRLDVPLEDPLEARSRSTLREAGSEPLVRFAQAIVLTKREVFELCEACAQAERALLRSGRPSEAARMASAFEFLESRLVLDPL